ncbi:glycosyltransferase family 4 protein [Pseudomonas sp. GD03858]|uniref:MraY family glycosyltransferase n=1 Tax=unclassified Pseudomonas TaxID=196821 RepID=UPI002449EF7D|nr:MULTISPECIES: glycosyltransferase family 4 protein [unclassified Pseudomonas]MDH0646288.1 glycosyltransferase family 4 protein [Pseudomonas sp. GD03867]MDH0662021.1 glycosyltransferase family 4 protein [Pseudomonas sp. GD03858]
MTQWWLAPLVLLISLLMTAGLRRYALARSIIDIPNARSSHVVPTPRGGGVAIVVSFLLALVALGASGLLDSRTVFAVAGAGGLIAIIGFMDDHGHIAARWRLLGHFIAAAWGLFWLGGLPPLTVFGIEIDLGWAGAMLAAVYLVWLLNLYNFMDGIDGIASVEAICVCLGACVLYWMGGFEQLMVLPVILIMAVGGFLYWNFPPAKIFMGDAGSGFLGIALGLLSLQAAWVSSQLFWCWLILLGVFVVDATFTLIRRLLRGDKVYEAHRSHAYQFASRRVGGHLPVTLAVALLTMCWLLPVAACVMLFGIDGFVGLLIAYVPLAGLAVAYNAGGVE